MSSDFPALLSTEQLYKLPNFLSGTSAWEQHIPFAFWLVSALRPTSIVELGTHKGDSYLAFCQAVKEQQIPCKLHAVDSWIGEEHAGEYGEDIFRSLSTYHQPLYGEFSRLMRMTFDEALPEVPDNSVDVLHIDGLHTYEAVRHDFEFWLGKMSPRGVVLFHDTQVKDRGFGVYRLWAELTPRYPHFEFHHGSGLGVLCVGSAITDPLRQLCNLAPHEQHIFRSICSSLGHRVSLHGGWHVVDADRNYQASQLREVQKSLDTMTANQQTYATILSESLGEHAQNQASVVKNNNQSADYMLWLVNQHAAAFRQLRAMELSLSWKITKPLRAAGKLLFR